MQYRLEKALVVACLTCGLTGPAAAVEIGADALVLKYLKQSPAEVETRYTECLSVRRDNPSYPDCWAARVVRGLSKESEQARALILSERRWTEAKARCKALSHQELASDRECRAVGQASSFNMLYGTRPEVVTYKKF